VDRAVVELPRHDADAGPVLGHQEVGGEILDVELRVVLQRLAIERVQDRVARAVGGGAGALHRRAFAELGRVAAEGALVDLAFLGAGEGDAVMLQLVDRLGRFTREVFHRVGVAQPVGPFHRVVHVPVPVVRPHVAERCGDAALRRDGVGACREDLGHTGGLQPLFRHPQRRAEAGAARADHDHVIGVFGDVVACRRFIVSFIA
jgi:hypothetical protein